MTDTTRKGGADVGAAIGKAMAGDLMPGTKERRARERRQQEEAEAARWRQSSAGRRFADEFDDWDAEDERWRRERAQRAQSAGRAAALGSLDYVHAPVPGTRDARTGPTVGDLLDGLPPIPNFLQREKGEIANGVTAVVEAGRRVGVRMKRSTFEAFVRHVKVSAMNAADNYHVLLPNDFWTDLEEMIRVEALDTGRYWTHDGNLELTVVDEKTGEVLGG